MQMQTRHLTEYTGPDGTLCLRLPLAQPDTAFEVVVIVRPRPDLPPRAERFAAMNAIRAELAASGRDFGDSAVEQREGRDER